MTSAPVMPESVQSAISRWRPKGLSAASTDFARQVVTAAHPGHPQRARSLLWAASRLCEFGISIGLAAEEKVLLRPALIERFVISGELAVKGRRTVRADLRHLGRQLVPEYLPAGSLPLERGRSKIPYCEAEIAGYLALADAQMTMARRLRCAGLVAAGAGAGLVGADLRHLTGDDVAAVDGRVVVSVPGRRARVVLVDPPYDLRVLAAARFAGSRFLIGGREGARHNVTTPLIYKLSGGADLGRLEVSRLRAYWLAGMIAAFCLPEFLSAAGISSSKHLFDLLALQPSPEPEAVLSALRHSALRHSALRLSALRRAGAGQPF
jgi:hypothetical protein